MDDKRQESESINCELHFGWDDNYGNEHIDLWFDDIPAPMVLSTFKMYCKRMALAMGYSEKSVEDEFGADKFVED